MHTKALAGAASEQRGVHGAGAAPVDAFFLFGPQEHTLETGVALDHAFGVVVGVMRQRLDGNEITGIDLDLRLQLLAEVAPMHRVGIRRQVMIGALGRLMLLGGGGHPWCH